MSEDKVTDWLNENIKLIGMLVIVTLAFGSNTMGVANAEKENREQDADNKEQDADIKELIKKWDTARIEFNSWTSKGTGDLKYRRNPFTNKTESDIIYLLNSSRDAYDEHAFVIPESLREAESEVALYYHKQYEETK